MIITRYVYSKLRWRFSIYNLSKTWVIQNLDSQIKEYIKRWLLLPPGANTRHFYLPAKYLGLKFSFPSDIYEESQLTTRKILCSSENKEIKELYELTKAKHINLHSLLNDSQKNSKKNLQINNVNKILCDLKELKEQNVIIQTISESCSANSLIKWQKICETLPQNIFTFVRKALIFNLPINGNLQRWKRITNSKCNLCQNKQTQLHVLNNCPTAVNSGRYTWRHNSLLFTICYYLNNLLNLGYQVLADLDGYRNTAELFHHFRPDAALIKDNEIIILELTCCFETNFKKSRDFKIEKYRNLKEDLIDQSKKLKKVFIEISPLGFYTKNIIEFERTCKISPVINIKRLLSKLTEVSIRSSYYIYTQRNNNDWNHPNILKFY